MDFYKRLPNLVISLWSNFCKKTELMWMLPQEMTPILHLFMLPEKDFLGEVICFMKSERKCYWCLLSDDMQGCRKREGWGRGAQITKLLVDLITISQPGGGDILPTHYNELPLPDFQTLRRPWDVIGILLDGKIRWQHTSSSRIPVLKVDDFTFQHCETFARQRG